MFHSCSFKRMCRVCKNDSGSQESTISMNQSLQYRDTNTYTQTYGRNTASGLTLLSFLRSA